ncbi:MAG: DUF3467 domain-containing protein [Patescibacteria group bacterium]|jgi:hypothetical protein
MPEQPKQELRVNAKPEELQGRYANIVSVTSQEREVIVDFVNRVGPEGQLVSRVVLNRFTAQELSEVLLQAIRQWEKIRYEIPNVPPEKT